MGQAVRILIAALLAATAACTPPGTHPAAATSHSAVNVECPDGKPDRAGLDNFGASIGTWQNNRTHDGANYALGIVPGYVAVRCSDDGFVVQEEIHPRFQSPAGQALRIARTDIPDDSVKVYDHTHAGCRVLQYSSSKLAQQLGARDADGRVDIVFHSDNATYNSASVKVILMDLFDRLGADTRDC